MKRETCYHLESDAPAPWIWTLGDGLQGGVNCRAPIPPQIAFWGDPAASLTIGELMPAGLVEAGHFRRDERQATYARLVESVGKDGLFCRVPVTRFSAARFATEYEKGRIRQRVSSSLAEELAGKMPFPIFFTHRRIPIFSDVEQRDDALELAGELFFTTGCLDATWMRPDWGIASDNDHGDDHYMRAILRIVECLDFDLDYFSDREPWQRARRFFKTVQFVEQVFGASWVTKIGEGSA